MSRFAAVLASLALAVAPCAFAQPAPAAAPPPGPAPHAGDFVINDFHFQSGETLPELRIHYTTFGKPHRDGAGHVTNAVLIMHGTGGAGTSLIRPEFTGELIGPGQLLDATKYFLIFPDDIGHGKSSKPSDGLKAHFPHYDYADMVAAEHRLVTVGLHVDHLRLVMGTSMGCMHTFIWGETWPDMMDALMPLACNTVQIAGRNRVWRDMIIDLITHDPAWNGGDYTTEPLMALRGAEDIDHHRRERAAPDAEVDAHPRPGRRLPAARAGSLAAPHADANDMLYQVEPRRATTIPPPGSARSPRR